MQNDSQTEVLENENEESVLADLGYEQQLDRRLSQFSNFAVSFSIISILTGGVNSIAQVTSGVGGAGIGIGWPLGCVLSGLFAVGIAQISSSFPTAGGLYHWATILGNRFIGWITAWMNVIGLVTALASINAGAWNFFIGAFGKSLNMPDSPFISIIAVGLMTFAQAAINARGIKLTSKLTDMTGYLLLITTIVASIALLAVSGPLHIERLWEFTNHTGEAGGNVWPRVSGQWPFLLGLLLPIYTITGYDGSAHTSEETKNATATVPRAIVKSVLWAFLAGWVVLSAVVLAIPDMKEAAHQGWNVFFWVLEKRLPDIIRYPILVSIFLCQMLCGMATVTSTSRMTFAFARDGGLPMSKLLASVNPSTKAPEAAIWATALITSVFMAMATLTTIKDVSVYAVVVSCTVIFLFLTYAIPVILGGLALGSRLWPTPGKWSIGVIPFKILSAAVAGLLLFILYLGVQPPNQWALTVLLITIAVLSVLWTTIQRRTYKGPPILNHADLDDAHTH
jgi:amino acid transporter